MKTFNRIFTSLLICLVLLTALAPAAYAVQDAKVEITGKKDTFAFTPGSVYSSSDLFPEFKNAFPGDTLTQQIYIDHKGVGLGSVRLYLRVLPHSDTNLPQDAVRKHEGSVAEMNDFLSQLEMKIWKGSKKTVTPIYVSSPDQPGSLAQFKELAVFKKNARGVLTVELHIPAEMGNEYADRMGEMDWEFMIEEIPPAIIPQTGDESNVHLMIAVSLISFAAIVVVLILLLKKNKK